MTTVVRCPRTGRACSDGKATPATEHIRDAVLDFDRENARSLARSCTPSI
jgi:hypothetical protein